MNSPYFERDQNVQEAVVYGSATKTARGLGGASLYGVASPDSKISIQREWQKQRRERADGQRAEPVLVSATIHYEPYELDALLVWQERARCRRFDPDLFFPEKGGNTNEAKKVCKDCKVVSECGEYALSVNEEYGVWGGMSERDRLRAKRRGLKPL